MAEEAMIEFLKNLTLLQIHISLIEGQSITKPLHH